VSPQNRTSRPWLEPEAEKSFPRPPCRSPRRTQIARVLILEPNRNQRLLLEEELEHEGHTVLSAASAEDALAILATHRADLVVLEIRIPGIDGLDFLGRLHGIDRRLPAVIHTADDSYRSNFLAWVADAYVLKRSDLTKLKEAVRAVLERTQGSLHASPALGETRDASPTP